MPFFGFIDSAKEVIKVGISVSAINGRSLWPRGDEVNVRPLSGNGINLPTAASSAALAVPLAAIEVAAPDQWWSFRRLSSMPATGRGSWTSDGRFADPFNSIGVECEVVLNLCDGVVRRFIAPDRVDRPPAA